MNKGKIVNMIYTNFSISKLKMTKFPIEGAAEFYAEHKGKVFYDNLMNFMTSDLVVGIELVKKDAIKEWQGFIGATNCNTARYF